MGIRTIAVSVATILLCGPSASTFAAPQLSIDPAGYQLVSTKRVSRVLFIYTYRATAVNNGSDAYGVTGTVSTAAPGISMMDDALSFGVVAAGGRVLSADTFTVLRNRNARTSAAAFAWSLTSASAFTLALSTDQITAFQSSKTTLLATVRRAAGFTADVTIALGDPPDGVAAVSPTLAAGVADTAFGIRVGPEVALGLAQLAVTASAPGVDPVTLPLLMSVVEAQPRSQELIRAARAAGTLDYGTSLLYRAYAWYGDTRLPAEFRGSGSEKEDLGLIPDIEEVLGTLSPSLESELIPFTLRPSDPGSWFNRDRMVTTAATSARGPSTRRVRAQFPVRSSTSIRVAAAAAVTLPADCIDLGPAGGWISQRSDLYPIRIWIQCADNSQAEQVKAYDLIQLWRSAADNLWPGMTAALFMGPPLPDNVLNNILPDIGDEAIDVYITENLGPVRAGEQSALGGDADGMAIRAAPPNTLPPRRKTSGYILVPLSSKDVPSEVQGFLAHELMHVLQYAHNAEIARAGGGPSEFWWFADATAEWAAAYFDRVTPPSPRGAHPVVYYQFDDEFLPWPEDSLNDPGDHRYSAFVWPYFMVQMSGGPNIIGNAWRLLEGATSWNEGDKALDSLLPFRENFPEFAKRNINSNHFEPGVLPLSDRYESVDPDQWKDNEEMDPRFYPSHVGPTVTHTDQIRMLAAQYWKFTFPDANTKKVVIDLSDTHYGYPGLELEALVKTDGNDWTSDLWDDQSQVVYCFDKPNERLRELWLVASNPLVTPSGGITLPIEFKVTVSDVPCQPAWVGTTTVTIDSPETYMEIESSVQWLFDEAATVIPLQPNFYPTGSATITHLVDKRCGLEYVRSPHSGTMASYQDGADGVMFIDYEVTPPTVYFSGATGWLGRITEVCDQDNPITLDPYGFIAIWVIPFAPFPTVSQDGMTIEGTQIINAETTQSFKFTRQDQ